MLLYCTKLCTSTCALCMVKNLGRGTVVEEGEEVVRVAYHKYVAGHEGNQDRQVDKGVIDKTEEYGGCIPVYSVHPPTTAILPACPLCMLSSRGGMNNFT